MNQTGPWSVKGIDQRARDAAREAASAEGLTLGEYLNRLLMSEDGPQHNEISSLFQPHHRPQPDAASNALDRLTRRIEAAEARSTLAITGMDHTVLGLVARLESAEQGSAAIGGHVEGLIEELRETHEALQAKVRRLEQDESAKQNLEALKSLEHALGKLASHVYEESELAQNDTQAIKGRVESGFSELTERVDGMEAKVETTLSDAAARVERAVEQAELRAEGTARHLSTRMSTLESHVHERLASVGDTDERLNAVEADVSGALESMESTLLRIQDRLNRAENTTDAALQGLETTFSNLDSRIEAVASSIDPLLANRLRAEFEARFEDMSRSVRETVDHARLELADEITRAATGQDSTLVSTLKSDISEVQQRLEAAEMRQSQAIETVSGQVSDMSASFLERISQVEARDGAAASEAMREEMERLGETVGARIDTLADQIDQRVSESENRNAGAIEQIGDQVATVATRLQRRQEEALKAIAVHVEETRKRTDTRLSDALANVSDRLEQMRAQSTASLSPVQRAIASLATRLESLEEFNAPPFTAPGGDTPDAHESDAGHAEQTEASAVDTDVPFEPGLTPEMLETDFVPGIETGTDPFGDAAEDREFFEAGIAGWDAVLDKKGTPYESDFETSPELDEDRPAQPQADPAGFTAVSDAPGTEAYFDPLSELEGIDGPHDSHTEARESDIFDESDEDDYLEARLRDDVFPDLPDDFADDGVLAADEKPIAIREGDTSDYIARARRAAIAAAGPTPENARRDRRRTDKAPHVAHRSQSGVGKIPLYAAASAVVITGAAVGGYLYIRGKQSPPVVTSAIDTYVDPGLSSEALASTTGEPALTLAAAESDLFETPAATQDAALNETAPELPAEPVAAAPVMPEPAAVAAPVPTPAAAPAPTPAPAPQQIAATASFPPISPFVSIESAAASGNHIAQFQLAQDRIAAGDFQNGAALMRKSAAKGLPIAQYGLAKLHERGTGVPKDLALAREWTEKAAEGGNVKAMHDLAVFMAEGDGGPQTYAGAVEWFRKAAEFGIVDSQYNLGVLYEQGLGISPNLTEALFWFEVAARNGDAGAPARIADLKTRVSPTAAAQAATRAASWEAARDNAISNGRFGAQTWNTGNPLQVQGIQVALSALGYQIGVPDGVVGPSTTAAIRAYEKANGLEVTGTITEDLIDSLNSRSDSTANG
ncbi:peptidoglycan-binding protein [Hyphomonas johnsonii]|uniref:Putative localization factor protein PodJ n=1 Tax=Hyphomonas johnsonii MHS-2 TaxID=1280950 RepID=A0A059FJJ1_9PROT|nr:peptidoglycan-binding protein [Hyphomonas johnsonii]KCZ90804.1 putative localization factor protein PodJ [Hyphomonas johnsonii MHS-2]